RRGRRGPGRVDAGAPARLGPAGRAVARRLVHSVRDRQRERSDLGFEAGTVGADHAVGAVHGAHGGGQGTEAGVFEVFARRQDRLLADHSGPLDPLHFAVGIGDDPLAADELGPLLSLVRDADLVGEEVIALLRRAAVLVVEALHLHADAPGRRVTHAADIIS